MTPLSKMTEEQCELWAHQYGTYEDMVGSGLVRWFDYMGRTFKVGAIIDVCPDHVERLTVEILSAGSRVRNRAWLKTGASRRAIIVKIVEDAARWPKGKQMSISLWEGRDRDDRDEPHIRHNALFGLANI